ncbi:MAG: GNAT family N-acetyltransferase [Pleurocapsa sp. MO_192.B19]|nr:GNAT family N-acetyltransferase [Pleurocapsa sp. MO_192.B19]
MLIRKATLDDVSAIARVHVDTWQKTYKGIIPDKFLANQSYKKRERSWSQILNQASNNSNFIYVAETENESKQIIGFINGGLERENDPVYQGELYAIYILPNYQRKGLGRYLFQTGVEKLARMGINSMLVWVLADNSACQFYEALGGIRVRSKEIERGSKTLTEVAYGWLNTATIDLDKSGDRGSIGLGSMEISNL